MRTLCILLTALALGMAGCFRPAPTPQPPGPGVASTRPEAPKIKGLPLGLTVEQRSTAEVSGTEGRLSITIDDITRRQVMVHVLGKDGTAIRGPVSMKSGDVQQFEFEGNAYALELAALEDSLVGNDFASFVLDEHTPDASLANQETALSEDEKIERLIAAVGALRGAVFIRNGSEHSAQDAADHLRRKLEAAGDRVPSASAFIDHLASRSSLTGQPYKIRLSDGRVVLAGKFLRQELAKLERHGDDGA